MPRNEIGSEFHKMPLCHGNGLCFPEGVTDSALVFSGRTAIETVLKNNPQVKKAILPSYCCDSMIEPFRRANIEVVYFSVNYKDGLKIEIPDLTGIDLLLWNNYFGFKLQMPDLSGFTNSGGIVVEDITHSFFSEKQYNAQSHYLVASIRKWEPVLCGGYCASVKEFFNYKPNMSPSDSFLNLRKDTMALKAEYLSDEQEEKKKKFLADFAFGNSWLAENYSELKMDDESKKYLSQIEYNQERQQRIKNARYLYKGLRDNSNIRMLFAEEEMDCPLFVPVLIFNETRDEIRRRLTELSIYCPVHWPHPNAGCESNIYDIELSLICDQRYNENDMKRIVSVICEK